MNTQHHRLRTFVFVLVLLLLIPALARFDLRSNPVRAQDAAAEASQRRWQQPQPRFKTSGAVGTPATFQAPRKVEAAHVTALQSPNDWTPAFAEDFEDGTLGAAWAVTDESDDGMEYTWDIDIHQANSGSQAVWVAAGGADAPILTEYFYPPNLDTWLYLQAPLDLSNVQAADVEFHMYVETEAQYDYVFVGVSVDGENYSGEYWTGNSGGWQVYSMNLAEYIGYDNVSIAWRFYSDENNADGEHEGVWLDDITIWTYQESGPAQSVQLIQNGSFETGDLSEWEVPAESTVVATEQYTPAADGDYVAWFGGIPNADERFYQAMTLPGDDTVTAAHFGFWVNQFGEETEPGVDLFCVWFAAQEDPEDKLVDLGCMDGVGVFMAEFDPTGWWQVNYTLTTDEWNVLKGRTVNLVFTMQTDDSLNTSYLVDDVTFSVVVGGDPGDAFEPNNTLDDATDVAPGVPISGLTISPDYDVDIFRIAANVGDTLVVDIDAAINGSQLDSMVTVISADDEVLCDNDDDGSTLDSYLVCELSGPSPYYVIVQSYAGNGGRNFFYTLSVFVSGDPVTPTPTPVVTPTPTPDPTTKRSWTAILYIDGDNNLCDSYPDLITGLENEVGAKLGEGGFLHVAVLFDRNPNFCAGQGNATRYLIQPDGAYTDNVDRWDMGELNMGDPQTLVNFANWAIQNYPADHYYLAIDNHGGGVSGIAWDDSNDHDNLTNAELYTALKQITQNGSRKLDVLAYEACLMGLFENAYDIHAFVDYIYFWPTISYAVYTYPAYLRDARFTAATTGRELGEIMFDTYYNDVSIPYVLSLVDTSGLPALQQAVNAWAQSLSNQVGTNKSALAAARSAAQKVDADGNNEISNNDYYVDLWDLADKLAQQGIAVSEAAALKSAIEATLVRTAFHTSASLDYTNAHGLTIYWPQTPIGDYAYYASNRIYQPETTGEWRAFLSAYFGNARGIPGATLGPIERRPVTATSTNVYLPMIQGR